MLVHPSKRTLWWCMPVAVATDTGCWCGRGTHAKTRGAALLTRAKGPGQQAPIRACLFHALSLMILGIIDFIRNFQKKKKFFLDCYDSLCS